MEHLSLSESINNLKKMSFEDHTVWIDNIISLDSQNALFYFVHLQSFINTYYRILGIKRFAYYEKLFSACLELKLLDYATRYLDEMRSIFGSNEPKILRLSADLMQIKQIKLTDNSDDSPLENALSTYKKLYKSNQHDRLNLKNYLYLVKTSLSYSGLKSYIDLLNEYLKVFMDDCEIWLELADIYIETVNYNKAIFCLEEGLLHNPHNYLLYIKIGDLLNSFNNTETSMQALKYYSKSILIKPTPKAFWGIIFTGSVFLKYKKPIEGQLRSCIKIAVESLKSSYPANYIETLYPNLLA